MASILRRRARVGSLSAHPIPELVLWTRTFSSSSVQAERGIEKILVANRGEIACRVMRTARRLGIRTVAVYSDADKGMLHVRSADEAVRVGPAAARASYLNASAILDAAARTGAQAIHPGYGFLSESAEFAKLCEAEGFTFIGPPASAIRDMGDKSASKKIMGEAGVPLVPGYHGDEQDVEFLKLQAGKIGYPVLIKPTHGGGGKGMRIVERPGDFVDSLLSAKREAAASFGIDTVLIEKYITKPRHVEVQVFGDKHGNVIHLYERDCSLQRRHQKIIEEAPAPNVSDQFRIQIGEAAVAAARAVGYYSAGTVEFIVDTCSDQFYFMEMNTRLQVEHPVTEMVVGQDLVEWQILVANGEPLPLTQENVPLNGHAFEARIYAENVLKGFLPATGTLFHYQPVSVSPTVRVETGVEKGDTVSMHYDPMIAKLVVWGKNRTTSLAKLKSCLSNFQIAGLPTNINFLEQLAGHWAFQKGLVETHFIEQYRDDLLLSEKPSSGGIHNFVNHGAMLVAACMCQQEGIISTKSFHHQSLPLWYMHPPFRMHHCLKRTVELESYNSIDGVKEEVVNVYVTYRMDGSYFVEIQDADIAAMHVKVMQKGDGAFRIDADGLQSDVTIAMYTKDTFKHIHLWSGGRHLHYRQTMRVKESESDESNSRSASDSTTHPQGSVLAPMAGLVVKVLVEEGVPVVEGQSILVLEAMKMEHVVRSPRAGFVDGLKVTAGQQVFDTSVLFAIKEKSDESA